MFDRYLHPQMLAKCEIEQARSVGHDCSGLLQRLDALPESGLTEEQTAEARRIYGEALDLGLPDGYRYVEPSTLEEIRKERRGHGTRSYGCPGEKELYDRILGGWIGRAAGCLVGKPVEGWSRLRIREALQKLHAYPLDYYFPEIPDDEGSGYHGRTRNWTRGNITRAPRDDDTDYTILGLHILETRGANFETKDVGEAWLEHLPFHKVYTAERVAYRNLVIGLEPPETALHENPYREWIGAQIRPDAFGFAAPALPQVAAELAFRDASLSHLANGIYGEMWVAAMLSGAFVSADPREVIEIGLAEIPHNCRLAEAIGKTLRWCREESDWEKVRDLIETQYGSLHGVHTINNASLVALGLMKSEGDFGRGVCISVMGGWDTDCNGATTGSVLGVMMGPEAIPPRWTDPLHDTLDSIIAGFSTNSISQLARRTGEVSKAVRKAFGA